MIEPILFKKPVTQCSELQHKVFGISGESMPVALSKSWVQILNQIYSSSQQASSPETGVVRITNGKCIANCFRLQKPWSIQYIMHIVYTYQPPWKSYINLWMLTNLSLPLPAKPLPASLKPSKSTARDGSVGNILCMNVSNLFSPCKYFLVASSFMMWAAFMVCPIFSLALRSWIPILVTPIGHGLFPAKSTLSMHFTIMFVWNLWRAIKRFQRGSYVNQALGASPAIFCCIFSTEADLQKTGMKLNQVNIKETIDYSHRQHPLHWQSWLQSFASCHWHLTAFQILELLPNLPCSSNITLLSNLGSMLIAKSCSDFINAECLNYGIECIKGRRRKEGHTYCQMHINISSMQVISALHILDVHPESCYHFGRTCAVLQLLVERLEIRDNLWILECRLSPCKIILRSCHFFTLAFLKMDLYCDLRALIGRGVS